MLIAIQGSQAVVYVYELVDGKQKVVQTTFAKNGSELVKKEEKKIEEKKAESVPVPEVPAATAVEAPAKTSSAVEPEDLGQPGQQEDDQQ